MQKRNLIRVFAGSPLKIKWNTMHLLKCDVNIQSKQEKNLDQARRQVSMRF